MKALKQCFLCARPQRYHMHQTLSLEMFAPDVAAAVGPVLHLIVGFFQVLVTSPYMWIIYVQVHCELNPKALTPLSFRVLE